MRESRANDIEKDADDAVTQWFRLWYGRWLCLPNVDLALAISILYTLLAIALYRLRHNPLLYVVIGIASGRIIGIFVLPVFFNREVDYISINISLATIPIATQAFSATMGLIGLFRRDRRRLSDDEDRPLLREPEERRIDG